MSIRETILWVNENSILQKNCNQNYEEKFKKYFMYKHDHVHQISMFAFLHFDIKFFIISLKIILNFKIKMTFCQLEHLFIIYCMILVEYFSKT